MIKKEKTQKIKGFMKRVASGLVSAAIALQTLTCFPMLLSSKVSAASAATGKSVGVLGKVNVELLQNLTYVDKDTFTLDLELKATYAVNAESERRDESTNG